MPVVADSESYRPMHNGNLAVAQSGSRVGQVTTVSMYMGDTVVTAGQPREVGLGLGVVRLVGAFW